MDDQARHDVKWVALWAVLMLVFALIGHLTGSAWWVALALIAGCFLYFYSVASYTAWRDRVAQAKLEEDGQWLWE